MDNDKALPGPNIGPELPPGEKPLTVGGFYIDGKFHEIKTSWWRNLLAKIWLKWSGWKFILVGYDEFRRIVDDTGEGHSADPLSRR